MPFAQKRCGLIYSSRILRVKRGILTLTSFLNESGDGGFADPAGPTGDNCDFPCEVGDVVEFESVGEEPGGGDHAVCESVGIRVSEVGGAEGGAGFAATQAGFRLAGGIKWLDGPRELFWIRSPSHEAPLAEVDKGEQLAFVR